MNIKILIIDDDEGDRELIKRFLETEGGFDFIEASTGEEGVEKAKTSSPDVVLLDTKLPGINGFEACKLIKEIQGKSIKVIMMTGAADAVDAVKARKNGADDYCAKADDCSDLIAAVKGLID